MEFWQAAQLSDHWRRFPPTHLLIRQIALAVGLRFRDARPAPGRPPELSDAEKAAVAQGPVVKLNQLPPSVRAFLSENLGAANA